ncbi:hypothetical protein [Lelliottia sp. T2.26D-8]|uniref:hypothetical protein n=1 Tax=Lelliottia sp. T2.26D-8 TaxID=3041165 RepID=UPI00247755BF|nr:hypothetical protein [Lelliottia sp. T2.26D-8]CAI9399308.1 hypothetical protein CCAJJPOJ_00193 [Lelliottia sp. T2.26D-8]
MEITRYHLSIDNGDEYVSRSQHGKYVRYDEAMAMVTALTSQLESVVAENAALKSAESNLVRNIINDLGDTEFQYAKVLTPATDAFLAEVRASGVEMAANMLNHNHPLMSEAAEAILSHAAQLRQGVAK